MAEQPNDPRLLAAYKFLQRTGARSVQLRYSDDEEPVVWFAVAEYSVVDGKPVAAGGSQYWEAASSLDPVRAALRLCELVCDGGQCVHCGRPTGFEPDSLDTMPMNGQVCWYQYDPGANRFIRGCA